MPTLSLFSREDPFADLTNALNASQGLRQDLVQGLGLSERLQSDNEYARLINAGATPEEAGLEIFNNSTSPRVARQGLLFNRQVAPLVGSAALGNPEFAQRNNASTNVLNQVNNGRFGAEAALAEVYNQRRLDVSGIGNPDLDRQRLTGEFAGNQNDIARIVGDLGRVTNASTDSLAALVKVLSRGLGTSGTNGSTGTTGTAPGTTPSSSTSSLVPGDTFATQGGPVAPNANSQAGASTGPVRRGIDRTAGVTPGAQIPELFNATPEEILGADTPEEQAALVDSKAQTDLQAGRVSPLNREQKISIIAKANQRANQTNQTRERLQEVEAFLADPDNASGFADDFLLSTRNDRGALDQLRAQGERIDKQRASKLREKYRLERELQKLTGGIR